MERKDEQIGTSGAGFGTGSTGFGSGSSGTTLGSGSSGLGTGTTGSSGPQSSEGSTQGQHGGLVEILEKIGVNPAQLESVRNSLKDMNIEESLDKARTYVNDSLTKARTFAKKNPGAVIGGLSALVIAAGLLTAAMRNKDND